MLRRFNPKISIIIPVYNGSNYLKESINSALAQTYKNIEIIVVNDGSNDDGATEEIAKSYGKKIRYFAKKNGGTATALNLGIKNMQGSYFSWLSHDDMYYPQKIKRQIEELGKLKNKNTIMMTDLDGINEKYEKIYETDFTKRMEQYPLRKKSNIYPIVYNQTHGCTLLIPKICFDELGLFNEKELVAQDFEFFYRAFLKFPHKLVPEVLVTARDSSNRQGKRSKVRGSKEYSDLYIKIIKNLSNRDIKLLAPSKLDLYLDMLDFFDYAGYTYASDFIRKSIKEYSEGIINDRVMNNLQISSYDLIGNKFNGHDLHLYLRDKGINSKQFVLHKESDDINTFEFDFLAKDSTKHLLLQKELYDTDIVHLHLIHNILDLNYLPILTRLKPTVITLHDPFFLGGHCVHHFDCEKWKTHCKDCPYLKEMFALDKDYSSLNFQLNKQAIQNSQINVIVASRWMESKVNQSPVWANKKVYFLPFGINQDLFKPKDNKLVRKKLNIEENSLVIMFRVANDSFKGLDLIKKTLSKIENSKKITLITVGQRGLLDNFKEKYNIIEHDWIKDDNLLVSLYQASDIFLMPSRQETFGMMSIEAMSCGKLVLAVNGEGTALPDVINSPACGIAVDEEDFAKELQRLINNPKEMKIRGLKSLKYARERYSQDIYIKKMIEIYKEIIRNHKLDDEAELIIRQLKKHMEIASEEPKSSSIFRPNSYLATFGWSDRSFTRKLYRKILPIRVRDKIKTVMKKFLYVDRNIYIKPRFKNIESSSDKSFLREVFRNIIPLKIRKRAKIFLKKVVKKSASK